MSNRATKKLVMNRLCLAGVTLLALVAPGFATPAALPSGFKASPPLVYKAKPTSLPASTNNHEVLFRRFLEWRKKQPQ
jgi:hypothetical protein